MNTPTADAIPALIERWYAASGSERANYQLFLTELTEALDLPRPQPATGHARDDAYVFERRVDIAHADAYARAQPADEGRPPFIVVVDVGRSIELYADFSRSGTAYVPYPDPAHHRIRLADLRHESIRARLRLLWLDPLKLDPSRESARVTRAIADQLAHLAKALEAQGYAPQRAAPPKKPNAKCAGCAPRCRRPPPWARKPALTWAHPRRTLPPPTLHTVWLTPPAACRRGGTGGIGRSGAGRPHPRGVARGIVSEQRPRCKKPTATDNPGHEAQEAAYRHPDLRQDSRRRLLLRR